METDRRKTVVYPLDGGAAERTDSAEPSVHSGTRMWSAEEGWVGWEEEWKVGVIQRYFRCWLLFRLPPMPAQVRAAIRLHLNRADRNWSSLALALYATQGEEWSWKGKRLGTLGTVQSDETDRWLEMQLPEGSLRPDAENYLELRAEPEETQGFNTRTAAAFDLLSSGPRPELILYYGSPSESHMGGERPTAL